MNWSVLTYLFLLACALAGSGKVEITNSVVCRRSEPDPALGIDEEFPHHGLGMREWIFDHFSCIRIQAPDQVLVGGGVPNTSLIYCHGVWGCGRSGQRKFLERFGFGIETADFVSAALAEPDDSVGIDRQTLRRALGGRRPLRHLFRFRVDLSDLAILLKHAEPDISIFIEGDSVGRRDFQEVGVLSGLLIVLAQRAARRP